MTKKDYELIADTLRFCDGHCGTTEECELMEWVIGHFADALEPTNPRFDRERFIAAATGSDAR